uniref:Uncharacterized protein n=1 Tax=Ascaris lumbricoides TaxID=6252 RepID=A0A0M3HUY1_ASCLU
MMSVRSFVGNVEKCHANAESEIKQACSGSVQPIAIRKPFSYNASSIADGGCAAQSATTRDGPRFQQMPHPMIWHMVNFAWRSLPPPILLLQVVNEFVSAVKCTLRTRVSSSLSTNGTIHTKDKLEDANDSAGTDSVTGTSKNTERLKNREPECAFGNRSDLAENCGNQKAESSARKAQKSERSGSPVMHTLTLFMQDV